MRLFYKITVIIVQLIIMLTYQTYALAETNGSVNSQNQAEISDGLGVELRFDSKGILLSIKSTYHHPVEFSDRRGIAKAYIIAEEKAKANIARYLNQVTTSSRVVTEVDDSLGRAARSKSNSGETWTKENTRNVTESIKEITTSSATAMLRGVRIIERAYDEKTEEVVVVVGINRESQLGAEQLGKGLTGRNNITSTDQSRDNNGNFPSTNSERRKSKDANSF